MHVPYQADDTQADHTQAKTPSSLPRQNRSNSNNPEAMHLAATTLNYVNTAQNKIKILDEE